MHVGGVRQAYVTVDGGRSGDNDEETLTLFLTRHKPRPMPAIVDKRGLVTMYGRATSVESRVPRLSVLVRLDRQHRGVVARMRRRYFAAVAVVFAIGMLAGALVTRPAFRRAIAGAAAQVHARIATMR